MDLPFDPKQRAHTVACISEHLGDRLGSQAAHLDDDELEELAFRVYCGEYGTP